MIKEIFHDTEFGGERPLFGRRHLSLRRVKFTEGESALKCVSDIEALNCKFEGKYPLWHADGFRLEDCEFSPGARAAIWYSRHGRMENCRVDAPKMFREVDGLEMAMVSFTDAQETLWHCSNVKARGVDLRNADYVFIHSRNIDLEGWTQHGNYGFQYCRNVEIRASEIYSKDAFWNSEDVTIENSRLCGEYLGWHSRRLTLINCHISGTQPLCYCHDLRLIDCTFDPDCDLAFEDSEVHAVIKGSITSVKNPLAGSLCADGVGNYIVDANSRAPEPVELHIRNK